MTELKKLIKEISKGFYDDWAIDYLRDLDAKDKRPSYQDVLNAVKDFLESRVIEAEEAEEELDDDDPLT